MDDQQQPSAFSNFKPKGQAQPQPISPVQPTPTPQVQPAPQPNSGAFGNFAPTGPATSAQSAPGYLDQALSAGAHLANTVSDLTGRTATEAAAPWSQIGGDIASTFREGQWLGADQPALAAARGISSDEQRKQDAAAYSRLGWLGMPVTGAGYALGGGQLGVGSKLAGEAYPALTQYVRPTVGRYLSGIIGSAGEGGLTNAASTLFHGGTVADALKSFWPGTAWGGAGGAMGGSQPDTPTNVSPVPKLKAQESKAYAPLDDIPYHGNDVTNNVNGTVNNIVSSFGPNQYNNATSTKAVVNDLLKQPWRSASDIQNAQEKLYGISRSPTASNEDVRFSGQVASGLDALHQNAQPTYGPYQPGDAADILAQGKPITQQRKNAEMLDNMRSQANLDQDPTSMAAAAKKELYDNPQFYAQKDPSQQGGYDVNDPRYQALQKLAQSAPTPSPAPKATFKHGVMAPLASAVGGLVGGQFGNVPEGMLTGGAIYGLGMPAFAKARSAMANAKTNAAYENAYPALTGQQAPLTPFPPGPLSGIMPTTRDFGRSIIYGTEANQQQR